MSDASGSVGGTERISRVQAEKERGLLEQDYATPCPNCGGVVFEWWDSDTCRDCEDSNEEAATEQTKLVTDGGVERLHRPPVRFEPSIIPMEEQHTERIKALWKDRFGAPEETIDNWVDDVFKQGKPTEGFVASDGGNVLGFGIAACCTPEYVEEYINHPDIEVEAWPKTGLLHMLCVDKEHEGRGIGTSLVEKRIQWLASQGVGGILAVSWHRDDYRDSRPLLEKYLDPVVTADDFYETAHGRIHCVDCEGVCKCGATIFKRSLQPVIDRSGGGGNA